MGPSHLSTPYHSLNTDTQRQESLLLQRRNRLPRNLLPNAKRLDPCLLNILELPHLTNVRFGRVARTELARTHDGEAALGVVARAGVAPRPGGKDGSFAGLEGGGGDVEDEFVPGEGGGHVYSCGRGWESVELVNDVGRRMLSYRRFETGRLNLGNCSDSDSCEDSTTGTQVGQKDPAFATTLVKLQRLFSLSNRPDSSHFLTPKLIKTSKQYH